MPHVTRICVAAGLQRPAASSASEARRPQPQQIRNSDAVPRCGAARLDTALRQHLLLPAEIDVLEAALVDGLPQVLPHALDTALARVSAAPPAQRGAVLRAQLREWQAASPEQDSSASLRYVLDAWLEALCQWSEGYLLGQLVYRICNRVLGEQGAQAVAGFTQAQSLYGLLHGGRAAEWLRWWSRQPPMASPWREASAALVPAALRTLLDPLRYLVAAPIASPVRLLLLATVCALASRRHCGAAPSSTRRHLRRIAQLPHLLETLGAVGTLVPPAPAPQSGPALGITHVATAEPPPIARRTTVAVCEPRAPAPHASPSWFSLPQAAAAGPGFTLAGGSGLRPDEARVIVLPVLTLAACAALVGTGALSHEEFNDAIEAWFACAGVTAEPTDEALEAMFEAADDRLRERLQSAQVPLLAQQLLQHTRRDTRVYLFVHALRRVHDRLAQTQAPPSDVHQADTWLHAFENFLRQQQPDSRIWQTRPAPPSQPARARTTTPSAPPPTSTSLSTPLATDARRRAVDAAWDRDYAPETPSLAWPYGPPWHRAGSRFQPQRDSVDPATFGLAQVVYGIADPLLNAARGSPWLLSETQWSHGCAIFSARHRWHDPATCVGVIHHRIARALDDFLAGSDQVHGDAATTLALIRLHQLLRPLHSLAQRIDPPRASEQHEQRAWQNYARFFSLVDAQQHLLTLPFDALTRTLSAVLPGSPSSAGLLQVLEHLLGDTRVPALQDRESVLHRLYFSDATTSLIARVADVSEAMITPALNSLFFEALARDPDAVAAAADWRALLQQRSAGGMLRSRWIEQATPAQAARIFAVAAGMHGDPAGEGLAQFIEAGVGADQKLGGVTWPLAPLRLVEWLEHPAGQAQLNDRLRRGSADPLLHADAPLPLADILSLLVKAVRHHVPALDAIIGTDIPSLAVAIRHHAPLLPARHCLLFAIVLRGGAATPPPLAATLIFPLSPPAVAVPWPIPELEPLLAGWGLPLFEALDPTLAGWQAWQLMAGTQAFSTFARERLRADGWHGGTDDAASPLGEQLQVAHLLLNQHVGPTRMQTIRVVADAPGIVAARLAVIAQLPSTRSPLARRVLLWLVARQLQRPELLVEDVPDWLDYGRSLLGVAFLQGVAMVEATNPGAAASWRFEDLVRLPAQLGGSTDEDAVSLVAAQVRPALLYARAHGELPGALDPATATAAQIDTALSFVHTRQQALAVAAGQLQRPAPERMSLAGAQLQQAQVPPQWWNSTLDTLPPGLLRRHGLHRRSTPALPELPGGIGMVADLARWAALGEALLEEQLAQDSLQQLLVSGEFEIAGSASIAQVFEQEFTLYQQVMTDALAVLAARSLEMLPPDDRALLAGATVTPLQLPAHHQGTLLRCVQADDAPVYLALVPSAGFSARLWHGERYDGTEWREGHWYDPAWFETGQVAAASPPDALRLLQPEHWTTGAPLAPQGTGAEALRVIAEASARSQYGDFFKTVKEKELQQRTGMERLWDKEKQLANALLEFCVPFYGCVSRLIAGERSGGVLFSCATDLVFAIGPVGRFLGSTTRLALRAGELGVHGLLEGSGLAVAQLGRELAKLSGAMLVRDLGRGVFRAGRGLWRLTAGRIGAAGRPWNALTETVHALPARAEPVARRWADDAPGLAVGVIDAEQPALLIEENGHWYRFDDVQRRAYGPKVPAPRIEGRVIDEIPPGFDADAPLHAGTDPPQFSSACRRVQRQVSLHACSEGIVRLFGYEPAPAYTTPGDIGWFAGLEVSGGNGPLAEGVPFVYDGQWWKRVRTDGQLRYVRQTGLPEPVLRQRLQATVLGGDGRLARIEVRDPYHGTRMRLTVGAVIGTDRQGGRVLIARIAPGRFHVAPLDPNFRFGEPAPALTLTPLEAEGFSAAHNDAVKGAWWGAFHYSQQCRLSGAALVDHYGSQLQQQVEALDEMGAALEEVTADAPYRFDTRPEHAVMSCARSNCRYVDALKQQVGNDHWRAPQPTDRWVHEALYDLLHPPAARPLPGRAAARSGFDALGPSLEPLHLTPRRGPAKTVAMARITLRGQSRPLIFHSVSGQRGGKGLLPASNLPSGQPAPEWNVAGRQITTPDATYIDAQPTRLSIADGQVASTVPNHSLHVANPDGMLSEERNARAYDAERNLYYRIERWLAQGRLAPEQVESVSVFSSRPVCSSCHVSIGSLRARFPGRPFEVIERDPAALAVPAD